MDLKKSDSSMERNCHDCRYCDIETDADPCKECIDPYPHPFWTPITPADPLSNFVANAAMLNAVRDIYKDGALPISMREKAGAMMEKILKDMTEEKP